MKKRVCAVFDVGKTNKKLFLFDENYHIVYEQAVTLPETTDEDGDPCEDLAALTHWLQAAFDKALQQPGFEVVALNISAYGASFVHTDAEGRPLLPLYNYLKPYPADLQRRFYKSYGGEETVTLQTASPALGSLNSGLQLYRLRHQRPDVLTTIAYCLHLPQFISVLFGGKPVSELTSIGCHTALWDFSQQAYHPWLRAEKVAGKLPPMASGDSVTPTAEKGRNLLVGTGLHDSSAALIPYLQAFTEPFVLLSTGTWNIALNPFDSRPLSTHQLRYDGLCYLSYTGTPVKAARLFAGHIHAGQTQRLAEHFHTDPDAYRKVSFNPGLLGTESLTPSASATFPPRSLQDFPDYATAYHALMADLVRQQLFSLHLVLPENQAREGPLFVDGGFSQNPVFMQLLARAFPQKKVYAATVAQATALGAALAIHRHWNPRLMPEGLVALRPIV